MKLFFIVLTIIFFVLPVVGIILLIRYVIKKSSANQPPHVLAKEKQQLIEKVNKTRKKLKSWQPEYLIQISNEIDYNYSKGFTRKFNGIIKSSNSDKIIAFRRLDRGLDINSKIMAVTSDTSFYFEVTPKPNLVKIFVNDQYLGKIENHLSIFNADGIVLGYINRKKTTSGIYDVVFNEITLAQLIKNSDRRMFLKNPFHNSSGRLGPNNPMFIQNDVKIENSLVNVTTELNDYEYRWILALAIFECIYYGIDFNQ